MSTVAIQLRLASMSVNGNDNNPESFKREMFCSTCAWARMMRSSSTGSPSWSV